MTVAARLQKGLFTLLGGLAMTVQAHALSVEHNNGTVEFDTIPERVVVLGIGSLDILDRLDVQPVGAVHDMIPPHLQDYHDSTKNVGSLKEPDYELIYTLKPDVIIAEPRMLKLYDNLNSIAPTVMFYSQDAHFWDSTRKNWEMMGKLFGKEQAISEIIKTVDSKIAEINKTVTSQKLDTLMVMNNGSKLAMYDRNSRFSVLFNEFGFVNASDTVRNKVTGAHGNLISFEYIAEASPSVMFVLDRDQAVGREMGLAKKQFDNPLVTGTPAAKNSRMVYVDPNAWYINNNGITGVETVIADVQAVLN